MHHHNPSLKPDLILHALFSLNSHISSPGHDTVSHPSPSILPLPLLLSFAWSSCLLQLCPYNPHCQSYCQSDLSKHKRGPFTLLPKLCNGCPLLSEVPAAYQNLHKRPVKIMPLPLSFIFHHFLLRSDLQTHQTSFSSFLCHGLRFWVFPHLSLM